MRFAPPAETLVLGVAADSDEACVIGSFFGEITSLHFFSFSSALFFIRASLELAFKGLFFGEGFFGTGLVSVSFVRELILEGDCESTRA